MALSKGFDKTAAAQLRTVLAHARAKDYKIGDRTRAFQYRAGIQKMLLARTPHIVNVRERYFETLGKITKKEDERFNRQPFNDDYLRQLIIPKTIPLELEIAWIAARLKYCSNTINRFLHHSRRIEWFVICQSPDAIEALNECDLELGESLWSTTLRIGVFQQVEGLASQKEYLERLKSLSRGAARPYLANAVSQRCEPTVSIGWFLDETRRRLARGKQSDITTYLRFKLLDEWPENPADCSAVLRMEQNHHIVDVYETFISFLQHTVSTTMRNSMGGALRDALVDLRSITDFRLDKLQFLLVDDADMRLPIASLEPIDRLLSSQGSFPSRKHIKSLVGRACSPESVVALALARGSNPHRPPLGSEYKTTFVRGLAAGLARGSATSSGDMSSAIEELRKQAHVFGGIALAKVSKALLRACLGRSVTCARASLLTAACNSSEVGILDLLATSHRTCYRKLRAKFPDSIATRFADVVHTGASCDKVDDLRDDAVSLANAYHDFLSGDFDRSITSTSKCLAAKSAVVRAQSALIALNACARNGDVTSASMLIVQESIHHGVDTATLPIREVFENLEWRDLIVASDRLELSIALSLLPSTANDDKIKTYRRFALEALLRSKGIERPSEFRNVNFELQSPELRYFLSKVCTPAMLDMLPAITSSRQVLEERREICGFLTVIDKEDIEAHQQEVLEISRELTVLDGLRRIDSSRVHVDVDSLSRIVKRDLADSFQRYTSIIDKNGRSSDLDFKTILKDLLHRESQPKYLLEMPVSETDELLISMIRRAREMFLFDVPHGLDSYLSKRIRHGSIVGFLRSPAEREGMVSQRNSDGSYRLSGTWADKLSDPFLRTNLAEAIGAFSRNIDQYLVRLKDVLLHVRSDSKPLGLFDIPLTPPTYLIIRSVASAEKSIDSFVDIIFRSLWALLGPSLVQAQELLRGETLRFVSEQFRVLRARAQATLRDGDDRAEFDGAAGAASAAMQVAITTAATWFEPWESTPRDFTLGEILDIAIASVRATTRDFSPSVSITESDGFMFSTFAFPVISDILYIAFGNIAGHSNLGSSPNVWLSLKRLQSGTRLLLRIENEVALVESEHDFLERLSALREQMGSGQAPSWVRREGGSGLYKLASIAAQSKDGRLEFGYSAKRFFFEMELEYSPDWLL